MKRLAALAPPRAVGIVLAFAALPIASFLAVNRGIDPPLFDRLLLYPLVLAAPGVAIIALVHRRRPAGGVAAERAAIAYAAVLWAFFRWEDVEAALDRPLVIAAVVAVIVVGVVASRYKPVRDTVLLAGWLLVAVPLVQHVLFDAGKDGALRQSFREVSAPPVRPPAGGDLPDVHVFVLDGYGSADELRRKVDADIGPFQRELGRRGFRTPAEVPVPYTLSEPSISSVLMWDYAVLPSGSPPAFRRLKAALFETISGDNRAAAAFKRLGYRFHYGSDYPPFRCRGHEDVCVEPSMEPFSPLVRESEYALMLQTPAAPLIPDLGLNIGPPHIEPAAVADAVAAAPRGRPVFSFTHILSPHHPYRYDGRDCSMRPLQTPSAVRTRRDPLYDREEEPRFAANVRCLNRGLVKAIDRLIARDPDAIVVLQGDHGTRLDYGQADTAKVNQPLRDAFHPLYAIRMPKRCGPAPRATIETFPRVLSCVTGAPVRAPALRHFFLQPDLGPVDLQPVAHDRLTSGEES